MAMVIIEIRATTASKHKAKYKYLDSQCRLLSKRKILLFMPPLLPSPPYSSFLVDAHCHLIQASSSAAAAAASLKRTALDAANPDAFPAPQTAPTTTLFSMTCSLKEARELNWCLERAKCQQPPSPSSSSPRRYLMVPCFGIHPWFIKQHLRETAVDSSSSITCFKSENITQKSFQSRPSNPLFHSCQRILDLLESFLVDHPASESSQSNWSHAAIIGEIGLDGLVTGGGGNNDGSSSCSHHPLGDGGVPLETQTAVFLAQLLLAFKLGRPVSVHAVKCWPLLLDVLECLGIWIGLEPAKKRRKS